MKFVRSKRFTGLTFITNLQNIHCTLQPRIYKYVATVGVLSAKGNVSSKFVCSTLPLLFNLYLHWYRRRYMYMQVVRANYKYDIWKNITENMSITKTQLLYVSFCFRVNLYKITFIVTVVRFKKKSDGRISISKLQLKGLLFFPIECALLSCS